MVSDQPPAERAEPPRATRLTFSYDGSHVSLLSVERLEMVTPPSDSLEPMETSAGFRYEVQAGDGRVLYRQLAQDPTRGWSELPTDDSSRPVVQAMGDQPKRLFVVLVPHMEKAHSVTLFAPVRGRDGTVDESQPARELFRFSFDQPPTRERPAR